MSYPLCIQAVICYIEAHITDETLNTDALEKQIGFSWAHIRDLFRRNTGYPIVQYIRMRKIKRSSMDLLYTDRTILEIACQYGFSNPETYTRAFYRITGMTPSEFRIRRLLVGKEELATGIYGIEFLRKKERRSDISMKHNVYQNNESTILYGVPKVSYGAYNGSTPYPICLKACAEYLGEDIDYDFAMVSGGAAFRFAWNTNCWDLSNVDIYHTLEESNQIYARGATSLGREFFFLGRDEQTSKTSFLTFIKSHLDEGYPCIALGIIGPPEACIIAGYRKNGEELLGWNFFQNDPAFSSNLTIDESGYFICNNWWENTDTQAVMCIGAVEKDKVTVQDILKTGVKALSGRMDSGYAKGVFAYNAWKASLLDEKTFSVNGNYSLLFEKLLCHNDAINCLLDGRSNAASFFRKSAQDDPLHRTSYEQIADAFSQCVSAITEVKNLIDSADDFDEMMKNLSSTECRKKSCTWITRAETADTAALRLMQSLIQQTADSE